MAHPQPMPAARMTCRGSRSPLFFLTSAFGALWLAGCGASDEIVEYTVPKPHVVRGLNPGASSPVADGDARGEARRTIPGRLLGAVVPAAEQTWFFKLIGPEEAVATQRDAFRRLMESLRFADDGKPEWTLPEGWREHPGTGMRFATLLVESPAGLLELTVISLDVPPGEADDWVLMNVNRWRGEMGLAPVDASRLAEETEAIPLSGGITAVLVDAAGMMSFDGKTGGGPMASRPSGEAAPPGDRPASPRPASGPPLQYDLPEGWTAAPQDAFSVLAFEAAEGDAKVRITVSALAAAAADPLPNVNRWRGQIQLDPLSREDLERELKTIALGPASGDYVELIGPEGASPREAILGVIAVHGGRAWFVKLQGPVELARREQERFEAFVQSVRFGEEGS